ncbi:hypothetical protein NONO_c17530 [Nocardia nova SH22a]|uniref:Uncharacterized protein n=1 Tax=Nocardia nova SH22a TaxID=1415166 RepID=W5TC54_9NOCA|nr:hypothetical protein [Nocardia nova]AHH16553.1 hypothetical protein NONO_c17530 [Nocardia nova SH22a]
MSPQHEVIRTDFDTAMDIYLDGMTSGICTALLNFAPTAPEEIRDQMADSIMSDIKADPLVMDRLRHEVMTRLHGLESEPWNFEVFGGDRR